MKQMPQTPRTHTASRTQSAESQTSTSSGAKPEETAARLGAYAGNPTADELAAAKAAHKMKTSIYNGKPFYTCTKCGYSTSKEDSAKQHEKAPI